VFTFRSLNQLEEIFLGFVTLVNTTCKREKSDNVELEAIEVSIQEFSYNPNSRRSSPLSIYLRDTSRTIMMILTRSFLKFCRKACCYEFS